MASGDTLGFFTPYHNEPPAANYATLDTRNQHPVLDFDDGTDEEAVFTAFMPRCYDGGGVTITLVWTATAVAGNVVWNTALERMNAGFDVDGDSFAAVQAVTDGAPGGAGELQYAEIAHTDGAQMDNVAAGEMCRLKVRRDADNGSDTLVGDAELLGVEIRET